MQTNKVHTRYMVYNKGKRQEEDSYQANQLTINDDEISNKSLVEATTRQILFLDCNIGPDFDINNNWNTIGDDGTQPKYLPN